MRPTPTTFIRSLVVVASALGCEAQAPRPDVQPQRFVSDCPLEIEIDGSIEYDCVPFDDDVESFTSKVARPDLEACARINAEAQALIDAQASCEHDRQCDLRQTSSVFEPMMCIPAFKCYFEVTGDGASGAFVEQALQLEQRYANECRLCPVAQCIEPDYVRSLCEGSTCQVSAVMPPVGEIVSP